MIVPPFIEFRELGDTFVGALAVDPSDPATRRLRAGGRPDLRFGPADHYEDILAFVAVEGTATIGTGEHARRVEPMRVYRTTVSGIRQVTMAAARLLLPAVLGGDGRTMVAEGESSWLDIYTFTFRSGVVHVDSWSEAQQWASLGFDVRHTPDDGLRVVVGQHSELDRLVEAMWQHDVRPVVGKEIMIRIRRADASRMAESEASSFARRLWSTDPGEMGLPDIASPGGPDQRTAYKS